MELRMYKYRLYPSKKQRERIINSLKTCKTIYNELLETSINTYKESGKTLRKFDYNKMIKGKYPVHSQVAQNVSDRVHKSFSNFFRRVKDKSCKEKGFPRFKSRVNSLTFPQSGFKLLSDKRIKLSKIGSIPIVLHRVPKGKIKTMTIKVNKANQWFAVFSCEINVPTINHPSTEKIGIDVNSRDNFCFLSNGESIDNPKYLVKSERRLKRLQRRLSRKVKGSVNRRKARFKVARLHNKIANQRVDFLHKLSKSLALKYSTIAVEDLNIKSMIDSSWNAKFISDASWGSFINMLSYKAVICGGQVLKNPRTRGSSHRCSNCGEWVDMPLNKRIFKCPKCFVVLHRDLNASRNHIKDTIGLMEISTPVETSPSAIEQSVASAVVEAGTTYGK